MTASIELIELSPGAPCLWRHSYPAPHPQGRAVFELRRAVAETWRYLIPVTRGASRGSGALERAHRAFRPALARHTSYTCAAAQMASAPRFVKPAGYVSLRAGCLTDKTTMPGLAAKIGNSTLSLDGCKAACDANRKCLGVAYNTKWQRCVPKWSCVHPTPAPCRSGKDWCVYFKG